MKVGIVYTSTTPELIQMVNEEIRKNLGDRPEIMNYEDPSILAEVREHGYVTAGAAARLVGMYMQAVSDGADAVLNCCSSVGEVADAAQDIGRYTGIPIVRIDEEMCREAVRSGSRIGVLATLPTTLEPTKNTILRAAREMNRHVSLTDGLIDGAFGIDQEQFKEMLCSKAAEISDRADVILLAQGSMAYAEEVIREKTGKPVFSSPRFGASALRSALEAKGIK
ncbi:MAG: aspartate/glutamate racemase family protein [Eubacteriales bacterium]|nr:aspartate/glutamate racemase family protein [Eubacteriales bacterium]